MAKRGTGRRPSRSIADQIVEAFSPEGLRRFVLALEMLQARPGATRVMIGAAALKPTPHALLKWLNAAKSGKPIPHTVDYLDGTPPVTIEIPWLSSNRPEPRRPGRPRHPLTLERFMRLVEDLHLGDLSERRQAQRLTIALRDELGPSTPPVTRGLVRARRDEAAEARRRRSAPRAGK